MPPHVLNYFITLTQDDCKALPYEKLRCQGFLTSLHAFMALRFKLESSSDCPPDKKTIPGTAGTTVLEKAKAVLYPIS